MDRPSEKRVKVLGLELRVLEGGEGPTLLFLHGGAGAGWYPLIERLSDSFHVVMPEHPGFGSERPDWIDNVGDLAFLYRGLLRALDLRDVVLAGHSLGGWLATELAVRSTERLSRLVLLAPGGIAPKGGAFPDVFSWGPEETIRRQFHDQSLAEGRLRQVAAADPAAAARGRANLIHMAGRPLLENPRLHHWLPLIDVPTLLIWGEGDQMAPLACHERFLEGTPDVALRVLTECGHALTMEHVEETAALIGDFARQR